MNLGFTFLFPRKSVFKMIFRDGEGGRETQEGGEGDVYEFFLEFTLLAENPQTVYERRQSHCHQLQELLSIENNFLN